MAPKRPPPPDAPGSTVMIGGDDEDLVSTSAKKISQDDEVSPDGATAFVRVDKLQPADDYNDGAGNTMRTPEAAPDDEAAGATAFVRIDTKGSAPSAPPPRRPAPGNSAPKKGL